MPMPELLNIYRQRIKEWILSYHTIELEKMIGDTQSLLDLGCGINSPVELISKRPPHLVGVDGFQPSIDESRRNNIHDDYVCAELLDIDNFFETDSFECVMALGVIEHYQKEKGYVLLEKMEKLASQRVIISTTNGFVPQAEHSGNILQKHLSGWSVDEMQQRGYKVIGFNGWKPLHGEYALPRFRPRRFWTVISRLTEPLIRNHPNHAFQILCVKNLQPPIEDYEKSSHTS